MSGDDNDEDFSRRDSVSFNDNISSTTNPTDATLPWMSLVVMAEDDVNDDPGDYNKFWSDYDLDNDGVFDNDDADIGEVYFCMTLIDSWLPPKEQ